MQAALFTLREVSGKGRIAFFDETSGKPGSRRNIASVDERKAACIGEDFISR